MPYIDIYANSAKLLLVVFVCRFLGGLWQSKNNQRVSCVDREKTCFDWLIDEPRTTENLEIEWGASQSGDGRRVGRKA
jgi:hypothetical protein